MNDKYSSYANLCSELIPNYFDYLINQFYKILPMKEENNATLGTYLESFRTELLGFCELARLIKYDARFVSIISVVQYMIDNPDAKHESVKREVFKAINICKKLSSKYGEVIK